MCLNPELTVAEQALLVMTLSSSPLTVSLNWPLYHQASSTGDIPAESYMATDF